MAGDQLHPVLSAAVAAASKQARSAALGGTPIPALTSLPLVRVALWIANYCRSYCGDDEWQQYSEVMDLVGRMVDGMRGWARKDEGRLTRALRADAGDETVLRLALLTAHAMYATADLETTVALCSLAAGNAAALLDQHEGGHAVHAFLVALDAQLIRIECETAAKRYATSDLDNMRVLWRAHAPKLHFVAQLHSGRYALLVKLKGRWRWHEGDLPSVIATIPDELFADAASCLGHV